MTPSDQLLPRVRIGTIYVAKDWQTLPQLWPQVADELAFMVIISTAKIFSFSLSRSREVCSPLSPWEGMSRLNCFKTQWAWWCLCVVGSEKTDGGQNEPDGRRKLWFVWICPKQRIWCYFRRTQRKHC